jgi:hypothetical protein
MSRKVTLMDPIIVLIGKEGGARYNSLERATDRKEGEKNKYGPGASTH